MTTGPDIVIIDDDKDLVNSVRIILESRNYRLRAAHNGKDGYALIEERPPDLIILDVMMGTDTEGFDLAFKLQRNPKYRGIPILLISGFTEKMAREGPEAFQHVLGETWPVAHFLEKPIDPVELLSVVDNLVKGDP